MRYYVLCFSDYEGISPHIIAEVVRDGVNEDRTTTLASALAGSHAVIVTRTELNNDPLGRQALEDWESANDAEYYRETEAIMSGGIAHPRQLRLVDETQARDRLRRHVLDERHREVMYKARGLREVTRALVERSREQRAAIAAVRGKEIGGPQEVADGP